MPAPTSTAIAAAQALADMALANPRGVRKVFLDDAHGGNDGAKREANRWRTRIYQARANQRRLQYRMANPTDIISGAVSSRASDPDAIRTSYDSLSCAVDRIDNGWALTVQKLDLNSLGDIELL